MASIIERTRAAWASLLQDREPQAAPQGQVGDSAPVGFETLLRTWGAVFQVENTRPQRLKDFDKMDTGDLAVMLDQAVDAATMFEDRESSDDPLLAPEGFKIVMGGYGTSRARRVIEQFLRDTKIRREISVYGRDMLKYGDCFAELVPDLDDENRLVRVIHKPVKHMRVNRDDKGRLLTTSDPRHPDWGVAYQQVDDNGTVIAGWFPKGEVIHGKLYPDSALTYSTKSLFDDIREEWKKLTAIEQGMVVARIVRAYPRLLHMLDMSGKGPKEAEDVLRRYIQSIQYRQKPDGTSDKSLIDPAEDYFLTTGYINDKEGRLMPRLNKVEMLDPTLTGLGVITDVEYLRRKLFNRIPGNTVGIVDNNQGELTAQDIAYGRLVLRIQMRLEDMVREMIDTALIRAQVDPATVRYRLVWPTVVIGTSWKFADARFRASMADRNDLEMGVASPEAIMRQRGMSEEEIDQTKKEWMGWSKVLSDQEVEKADALAQIGAKYDQGTDTSAGSSSGAGNTKRRTGTKTIPTKGGSGQAAQGAKSGG